MKKLLFIALLSFLNINGQENPSVNVGDILIMGKPSAQSYQHIHFPKTNFIIKKGGNPNYKALVGDRVIITAVDKKQDGNTHVTFKPENGSKFFNSVAVVNASFEKAIEQKEILLQK